MSGYSQQLLIVNTNLKKVRELDEDDKDDAYVNIQNAIEQ